MYTHIYIYLRYVCVRSDRPCLHAGVAERGWVCCC